MREEFDESGSWCNARLAMELASVPRKRASRRIPMMSVARLSNLLQCKNQDDEDYGRPTRNSRDLTFSRDGVSFLTWFRQVFEPPNDHGGRNDFNHRLDAKKYEGA